MKCCILYNIGLKSRVESLSLNHFTDLIQIMDNEMKKIFRNNIIKFVIGIVLLSVSFGYIQNHPAEKASIFSGFEVLRQRVEVFVYKVMDKDPE